MPSLREMGLDADPGEVPLTYPGDPVPASSLLVRSWLYALHAVERGGVGDWRVGIDGGPLAEGRTLGERSTLDDVLEVAGGSPVHHRQPVLAVGSNASPWRLHRKLGEGSLVPLTRATVSGLRIGHSAHVSTAGYIPYAPFAENRGAPLDLFVLWLDPRQLQRLHETEPNYRWVVVSGTDYPASLESGQRLDSFGLYRGRWGLMTSSSDAPLVEATSQAELLGLLTTKPWFVALVPESLESAAAAAAALSQDAERRTRVRDAMAVEGLVASDGIVGSHAPSS